MSRSQKNVRRGQGGSTPSETGDAKGFPADVTKRDGATNIAGDVTRFSTDDYGPEKLVIQDEYPRG